MERSAALDILVALADGCDPNTGEVFPPGHVVQQPNVIRALGVAVTALREYTRFRGRKEDDESKPPRAGIAWTPEEDTELGLAFDQDATITALAAKHERTRTAIKSRLVKQGRLSPESDESREESFESDVRAKGRHQQDPQQQS